MKSVEERCHYKERQPEDTVNSSDLKLYTKYFSELWN